VEGEQGFNLSRGLQRQFLMGPVKRVARLKSHNTSPIKALELGSKLAGSQAKRSDALWVAERESDLWT
jgi:hypothetical protein